MTRFAKVYDLKIKKRNGSIPADYNITIHDSKISNPIPNGAVIVKLYKTVYL